MMIPDSDYQILQLSCRFYNTYPNPPFIEILKKQKRAYACLIFETSDDYFICVPYRTHINHTNAYLFSTSIRSQTFKSGLDYTKSVIIKNLDYLETQVAVIDKDEFKETMINLSTIKSDTFTYVQDYINHKNGTERLSGKDFRYRYYYSPLKYFHNELGINIGE